MRVPGRGGEADPRRRQRETRLGISGAERADPGERLGEFRRRAVGPERPVEGERRHDRGFAHPGRDPFLEEGARGGEPVARDREPGGHGVPAAFPQQPDLACRDHARAEIDARDRTARAHPRLARQRHHARWHVVAFLEPRGDDADDARMPALAGGESERVNAAFGFDPGDRVL